MLIYVNDVYLWSIDEKSLDRNNFFKGIEYNILNYG